MSRLSKGPPNTVFWCFVLGFLQSVAGSAAEECTQVTIVGLSGHHAVLNSLPDETVASLKLRIEEHMQHPLGSDTVLKCASNLLQDADLVDKCMGHDIRVQRARTQIYAAETKQEKMLAIFNWADKDGNGHMSRAESDRLQYHTEGDAPYSDEEWHVVCNNTGADVSQGMDFEEFKWPYFNGLGHAEMDYVRLGLADKAKMTAIFQWADQDGDGYVSRVEADRLQARTEGDPPYSDDQWELLCSTTGAHRDLGMDHGQLEWPYLNSMGVIATDYRKLGLADEAKMIAMFKWADKDEDGYVSRDESDRLQAITEGDPPFNDEQWDLVCLTTGAHEIKGMSFEQFIVPYVSGMTPAGTVEKDFRALRL